MAFLELRRTPLVSSAASALIAALNAELLARYPEVPTAHFHLDPDEVSEGRGVFLVAYTNRVPLGCGALRRLDARTGELKRMFVDPGARGLGVARALVAGLEAEAHRLGFDRLVLEVGERQPEAVALYADAGFVRVPPFAANMASPLALCMGKDLVPLAPILPVSSTAPTPPASFPVVDLPPVPRPVGRT